ncbi:uncharacterized protein EDB91DRAFT_1254692 [Suillus paluster]|uniref:uncharacterized protein n=1 Tax=Suillus paluster TaxID=48578 RepID=UPI001B8642EB|nr:uncharacterized protein EDB91DRAFT_1254692 [Suillus paluster]KAG1725551.1 hypothetical protein EDB91DRAFT_1254692 [Suillus paluster]
MNWHRQLVQYGDLEQSQQTNGAGGSSSATQSRQPPLSKKRKTRSNQKTKRSRKLAHWDDPGDNQMNYDDASVHAEDGEIEEEESRELSHEEIWDDSALIDAWNSATAEYEAFHGKTQDWKSNPVKKSPLWYNIPYDSSKDKSKAPNPTKGASENAASQAVVDGEENSVPFDFDTFVPSYDPSLPVSSEAPTAPDPSFFVPAPSTTMVSRDEAFSRALSAMYWGGYWTAVYHCQNQQNSSQEVVEEQDQEYEEGDEEVPEDDDAEDLVPAQR